MMLERQMLQKIFAVKVDGVIYLTKHKGRKKNLQHKVLMNKLQQLSGVEAARDRTYKISKVSVGQQQLVSISIVKAADGQEREVKPFIMPEDAATSYYGNKYLRQVCKAVLRDASIFLVRKDKECVIQSTKLLKDRQEMEWLMVKEPKRPIHWPLHRMIPMLHRFCTVVQDKMQDLDDHVVVSFREVGKKRIFITEIHADMDFDFEKCVPN